MPAGIYQIRNKETGAAYIGSAVNIGKRLAAHRRALFLGRHKNPKMQNAWAAHGPRAFETSIVLVCRPSDLILYEQLAIDGLKSHYAGGGYNLCAKAYSTFGRPTSARQRQVASERQRGVPNPRLVEVLHRPDRKILSIATIRAALSDPIIQEKRRLRAADGIRKPEARAKLRSARAKRAPMDNAHRLAISERQRGIVPSGFLGEEAKAKRLAAVALANRSLEKIERSRAKLIGLKRSPDTLEKLRLAATAREAKKRASRGVGQ